MFDLSIYTNYVNIYPTIDKLDGTNYDTWASDIKLWLKSQGYVDHLTQSVTNIAENEVSLWLKIDAQLCFVLKFTIHLSLKQFFRVYETCVEVWKHVKLLYTNDTQCLYGVCQSPLNFITPELFDGTLLYINHTQRLYGVCQSLLNIVDPKRFDGTMAKYLGKVHALFHDFNELLPPASTPSKELEQRSKFFMLLALYGLPDDYSHVRDQILRSPVVSNFTSTCSILLRMSRKEITDMPTFAYDESSALVSQHVDHNRPRKLGKRRHKCDHCGKVGHRIDRCYVLHGHPSKSNVVVQIPPVQPVDTTSSHILGQLTIFDEFLKWYEDRQNYGSTVSLTYTGTSLITSLTLILFALGF